MKMTEFIVPKKSEIHVRVFSTEESKMKKVLQYCQISNEETTTVLPKENASN